MRPKLFGFFLIAILLIVSSSQATIHEVDIGNFFFSPEKTIVSPGDTVRWTVVGGFHTTTAEIDSPKQWDSGNMTSGMSFDVVFELADGPGPFPYLCSIHPSSMKDTIFMNLPPQPTLYDIELTQDQANGCTGTGSRALGIGTAILSADETTLTIHIEHSVTMPIAGHIHLGAPCVSGGIQFPFTSSVSPIDEVWSLTATDVQNLKDGLLYANIHSNDFPAEEIRGQLLEPVDFVCGDANDDGDVNLLDILLLISFIYDEPPGASPTPLGAGDPNADGDYNLLDILYLIAAIYNDPPGPAPLCP